MYNRYIPEDVSYTPVEEHSPPPEPFQGPERGPQQTRLRFPEFLTGKEGLSRLLNSREGGGLSGLLKTLRLDSLDAGDILLLLIILYLLVEGDDLDLVIALGAVLLMGLGES